MTVPRSADSDDRLATAWHALRVDGNLSRARDLFDRAARATEDAPASTAFADAVLGVSGLWLHERRNPIDQARITTWRQSALAAVDPHSISALRLSTREAAEADYAAGGTRQVLAQLDVVSRSDDGTAVVEALHLAQHCLLGPEHAELRMALAHRLLAAAGTNDALDTSLSLLWRVTNLLLLGGSHADRALALFRAALEERPNMALTYVLSAIDVMVAIRSGDLVRAEELADKAAARGREAGDPDLLGWYGAHLVTIRYFQGRAAELTPMLQQLVASPDLSEPNDAFLGALATAASMGGDRWTAASAVGRLRRPSLATVRHNSICWSRSLESFWPQTCCPAPTSLRRHTSCSSRMPSSRARPASPSRAWARRTTPWVSPPPPVDAGRRRSSISSRPSPRTRRSANVQHSSSPKRRWHRPWLASATSRLRNDTCR